MDVRRAGTMKSNRDRRTGPAGGWAALGLLCLAGCHNLGGRPSPQSGPAGLGSEPSPAVTRAQEADMQITMGRNAERKGDFDQAIAIYKDALKRDKSRADAYQRLAIIHDRRGEFRESAELYRMALAASPGNADIFCDMGYSLYLQHRWAESEQNLKQAIALRPDHARAHNNLGLVLAQDRRPEEALAEYRKAGNDEAQARSNLALAMSLDGRWDEARDQYKKVAALDPRAAATAQARLTELDHASTRVASTSPSPSPSPGSTLRDRNVMATSATAPTSAAVRPSTPRPAPKSSSTGEQVLPRS